ncbi:hypothetical protein R1sor_001208 [Riccia sorocarpa]|uniref:NADH dehydrogenase [ubiquinone] 1 alpha subcomplex subunit 5 n=1 Tax=Riccia sorocarpa TaxID=122646 RepID=A0ABD3GZH2_9MARC
MFLRRMAGPLLGGVKEMTGIVGLPVVPNARDVLIGLYQKTLEAVKPIPESAQYRKTVEEITRHRLAICNEEDDWREIEKRVGNGQVEQLIQQAKDELTLIPKMTEWKPWEAPEGYKVQIVIEENDIPSHVPIHR